MPFALTIPILPGYVTGRLHGGPAEVGAVVGGYALTSLLCRPVSCIIELAGTHARVETYCALYQRMSGEAAGALGFTGGTGGGQMNLRCRYVDDFARRDGAWRIARRLVVYESVSFEDGPAGAPFGPDLTVARRDRGDALYA